MLISGIQYSPNIWSNEEVKLHKLEELKTTLYQYDKIGWLVGWLVVLRIYVALAFFKSYRDLEAGDNQSLKIKWRGIEPRTSCSAS